MIGMSHTTVPPKDIGARQESRGGNAHGSKGGLRLGATLLPR
jgi:hypothetical protein